MPLPWACHPTPTLAPASGCPIPPRAVAFDLVYNPPSTRFLREAKKSGARVIGGLEMLIYQGARGFELWTHQRAPIRGMRHAAANALQEMMENHPKGQHHEH